MLYEVFSIVEGAAEADLDWYESEERATSAADSLASDYRSAMPDADWQVYILPHYCDGGEDCACVQYLLDHSPYATSGAA